MENFSLDPDLADPADFQRVLWVVALVDSDLGNLTDVVVALGPPSPSFLMRCSLQKTELSGQDMFLDSPSLSLDCSSFSSLESTVAYFSLCSLILQL